jgi:hypothetical protein
LKHVDLLFSAFIPDRGGAPFPEDPGYLVDAVAVRPTKNGWTVQPDAILLASAAAVTNAPVSAYHAGDTLAQDFFAGSATDLYQSDDLGVTWSDVSRAGNYTNSNEWDWAQFDQYIFAAKLGAATPPQIKDITASTATIFADLGGGAPTVCSTIARVRDHLVVGCLATAGAATRDVQWSDIGDPQSFSTPGSATALARQAGSQSLPYEQGMVRKIVGGEKFGIVLQEHGMSRMTYQGGNVVYSFDNFNKQIGLGESRVSSTVQVGGVLYLLNQSGMYATDGYEVQKLSDGVFDDALIQNNLGHPNATLGAGVSAAHDKLNGSVLIANNNSIIVGYNYQVGKFFIQGETANAVIFDGIAGVNDPTPTVFGFDSDKKLVKYTAAPSGVNLQTGYVEVLPGRRVRLLGAQLLGSGTSTPTLAYKTTDTPNSVNVLQTSFTSMTAPPRGDIQTARADGRFFAFRLTGAQGLGAMLRGLRIYFELSSEQ